MLGAVHGGTRVRCGKGDLFVGTSEGVVDLVTDGGDVRAHLADVVEGSVVASGGGALDVSVAEVTAAAPSRRGCALTLRRPQGASGTLRVAADRGDLCVDGASQPGQSGPFDWHAPSGPGDDVVLLSSGGGPVRLRECSWFEASMELTSKLS